MNEVGKLVVSASEYSSDEAKGRRAYAVAAALEVIAARAAGPSGEVSLEYEFEQLSKYADQIQEALAKQ
ncbi:hypothetical protein [Stutzerimonas tarimensis]|uniref:DUF1843 domain-containing protein n=1 Tax=Stutzerimonas tarimensis TaxID=1507735 RepID=A0ABV7T5N6_9GAMM